MSTGTIIKARHLVPPLNGKIPTFAPDRLSDIDRIVVCTIMANGEWVLVDRNVFEKKGQSSKIYIALRRRGFAVVVRHVDGIKNYWARWPHDLPTVPALPAFKGDEDGMYGALPDGPE